MCWSGEASGVLAAIGIGSAIYSAAKRLHPTLWGTLGYFSLMELLQAFTYSVIDQCALPANQILTLFGYLHICFQPFFINAISMHFLPQDAWRQTVRLPAYIVCFSCAIVMLLQLFPLSGCGHCIPGEPLCASNLCSVHGNWHIAWNVPLNGMGFNIKTPFASFHLGFYYTAYFVAAFLMPLLYGVWRGTVFHLLLGPGLAWLTTNNMNEWPAIWCLLSIGIIMLAIKVRCDPVLSARLLKIRS
ncbi:MAG: DUF5765 domain-containing protein [Pseudomonadota bacterium]|nr:DUF5765 domain-containing protein [Pseudomonadota bacterium]